MNLGSQNRFMRDHVVDILDSTELDVYPGGNICARPTGSMSRPIGFLAVRGYWNRLRDRNPDREEIPAITGTTSMDEYRNDVERLAQERSGEPFYNSSIDHAAVIIEKIFRHAKSDVSIISKSLDGRVFGQGEVTQEVEGYLSDASRKVRILMEDEPSVLSEGHPFVRALKNHPQSYEVRLLSNKARPYVDYHFTLADDDSYRFEPDKKEWVAVAAFGDRQGAERLRSVFDSLWAMSDPVEFPATA